MHPHRSGQTLLVYPAQSVAHACTGCSLPFSHCGLTTYGIGCLCAFLKPLRLINISNSQLIDSSTIHSSKSSWLLKESLIWAAMWFTRKVKKLINSWVCFVIIGDLFNFKYNARLNLLAPQLMWKLELIYETSWQPQFIFLHRDGL